MVILSTLSRVICERKEGGVYGGTEEKGIIYGGERGNLQGEGDNPSVLYFNSRVSENILTLDDWVSDSQLFYRFFFLQDK